MSIKYGKAVAEFGVFRKVEGARIVPGFRRAGGSFVVACVPALVSAYASQLPVIGTVESVEWWSSFPN